MRLEEEINQDTRQQLLEKLKSKTISYFSIGVLIDAGFFTALYFLHTNLQTDLTVLIALIHFLMFCPGAIERLLGILFLAVDNPVHFSILKLQIQIFRVLNACLLASLSGFAGFIFSAPYFEPRVENWVGYAYGLSSVVFLPFVIILVCLSRKANKSLKNFTAVYPELGLRGVGGKASEFELLSPSVSGMKASPPELALSDQK